MQIGRLRVVFISLKSILWHSALYICKAWLKAGYVTEIKHLKWTLQLCADSVGMEENVSKLSVMASN